MYSKSSKSFLALIFTLLLFSIQLHAKNISEVLPILNGVAGLMNLPVTNVEEKDNYLRGNITVHNQKSLLVGFKVDNKKMGAVLFHKDISLGDIVPSLKGKPTDDVTLKKVAFIFVPKGNAQKSVNVSSLPSPIQHMIDSSVTTINLHAGLNIFSQAGIKESSKLASLLKKVKAYKDSYSLIGTLSPKLFSGNSATNIKNEILDGINLHVKLPKISFPGLPNAVAITHTKLSITTQQNDGKREIDLSVNGDLVATAGKQKIDFIYEADVVKQKGSPSQISITGHTKKGATTTIGFSKNLTLSDMTFDLSKKDGHWVTAVNATTTFKNKSMKVTYQNKKGVKHLELKPDMTLATIIGHSDIPVLKDVESDILWIYKDRMIMKGKLKGIDSYFVMFKKQNESKYHLAVVAGDDFTADKIIPDSSSTPLKDVTFKGLALIYNPNKSNENYTVDAKHKHIASALSYLNEDTISLKPGLNVFGHMNIQTKGDLTKLLNAAGMSGDSFNLPLKGKISPQTFANEAKKGAKNIKQSMLDALDIDVHIPTPNIPEVSKILSFHNGKLAITGKGGIDISVSGDADLKIKHEAIPFHVDVSHKNSDLSFSGHTETKWTHPMGIEFLTLDSLKLNIDNKKNSKGKKELDVTIDAKTDIGKHSRLDIDVNLKKVNGKIVDASFELDGPIEMSEIPGVKKIPNSSNFEIDTIKITEHGIEAKTDFGGKKDLDIFVFKHGEWNLILRQDNFAITEIITPLKSTPLKHIVLSEAALIISKSGLQGNISDFSEIGQDGLKDIYGKNTSKIDVDSGLSLVSVFEHKNLKGAMAGAFKRMGMTQEKVILSGDIGGIFGGPVKLNIKADLDAHGSAKNQPKWMKSKPNAEAFFSLIATDTGGQFDIEIGMGTEINANVHNSELLFDSKVALEFEDEKIDVKIVADLKDKKGWKQPFGIPGFTLYEVGLDLGLAEDGAIHLGFDGNIKVDNVKYGVKADADLLPEALGAPQDIAFVGSASKVDMFFMEEIALQMIGGNFKVDIPKGILPTFTDVKFAFVTPGAQDPDLHITGEGFALAGGMSWLDHEVGDMNVSVTPTKGIQSAGKIDDFKLAGVLDLKDNDFTIDIGVKSLPNVKVDSNIELLGIKEKVKVDFNKKGVIIDADLKLSSYMQLKTDFALSGIDMSAKHPEYKKANLILDGNLTMDIAEFVVKPASNMLIAITNDMNKAYLTAENALTDAENKVNKATDALNKERAKVRKERAAAEAVLKKAEANVNTLKTNISDQWAKYHRCHGWFDKWPCRIKHGIEIATFKVAKVAADEALKVAETLVDHFPVDLDPRIAPLILTRDVALTLLSVAKDAVSGLDLVDKFINKGLTKITDGMKAEIAIKQALFHVNTKEFIKGTDPVKVHLDAVIFGKELKTGVSMKISAIEKATKSISKKDLIYDAKQMEILAVYALHYAVKKGIDSVPKLLRHKLLSAIAGKFDSIQAANVTELATNNLPANTTSNAADTEIQADYNAYHNGYLKAKVASANKLNHEKSETFKNEYIEVGHTGLCLDNVAGEVKQLGCKENEIKWSTAPVSGAPGVADGLGFVNIKDPFGNCMRPSGKWKNVTKTFDTISFQGEEFQGNGNIKVEPCVNTKEYYWKVLKHGDGWMQIANLATSKCLHFEEGSSLPGKAKATWKSCVGSANQVYRVADKLTPKYYKAGFALRNDQLGQCLQESADAKRPHVAFGSCKTAATYDYMVNIKGDVKFINTKTGNCLKPEGYWLGALLTEVPCTQLDYQWWETDIVPGGITIKNAQTKQCTQAPSGLNSNLIEQVDCKNRKNSVFTPTTNALSGPNWATYTASTLPKKSMIFNQDTSLTYNNKMKPDRYRNTTHKTDQYICMTQNKTLGNVPGYYRSGYKMCGRATDNIWYSGYEIHDGTKNFRVLMDSTDIKWTPNYNRKIPGYAVVMGGTTVPMYVCRDTVVYKADNPFAIKQEVKTGWTINDGKGCRIQHAGAKAPTGNFEVLTRTPESFYNMKLSN